MNDLVSVQYPAIKFEDPDDVREVDIPDGHAAVRLVEGASPARIVLEPGKHMLSGVSFDDVDAPFHIIVCPDKVASMLARSRVIVPPERKSRSN